MSSKSAWQSVRVVHEKSDGITEQTIFIFGLARSCGVSVATKTKTMTKTKTVIGISIPNTQSLCQRARCKFAYKSFSERSQTKNEV